ISSLIYLRFNSNQIYTIYPGLIFLSILFLIGLGSKKIIWTRDKENIFEKINFKDKLGNYPKILKKQKFKKDKKKREMYVIKSLIPFSEWNSKKEVLEQLFNSKIGIRKTADRQIIKLFKVRG
ncbi:MAG: hypothetical protein JW702_05600, partial [Clostridiales bacterium]|nr:hypothetical protein [Clostridiales bacterium]